MILDELNVKQMERTTSATDLISYIVKPNLPLLGQKYGQRLNDIRNSISAMDVNELVRSLQSQKSIELTIENETLILEKDAFIVEMGSAEGYTSEMDGGVTVGLTTELNEELLREGMVRDLIRHVQIMRKNANFAVEDRIIIHGLLNGLVGDALKEFEEFFCNETLAVELTDSNKKGEYESTVNVQGQELTISIERKNT